MHLELVLVHIDQYLQVGFYLTDGMKAPLSLPHQILKTLASTERTLPLEIVVVAYDILINQLAVPCTLANKLFLVIYDRELFEIIICGSWGLLSSNDISQLYM